MRNLKRALSLALASVMLLGMMVVGSSAKGLDDFSDNAEIVNKDAVAVTSAIGLFDGYEDGSFGPENVVTRAEMAVIICTMLYGAGVNVNQFAETSVFTDVPAWAQGYVNLCSSLGIVAGVGDGKFDPNATVTTAQAVLMLCRALGYFQNAADFGDNWMLAATAKGTALGLYGDLKLTAEAGLTRDNVAELVFNALTKAVPVQYNELLGVYYNENQGIIYSLEFNYLLTLAYCRTYGLAATVSRCSNNYGPRQFPEKLIPLMIVNALRDKPLPVYGTGKNVRDWLYVEDHCRAIDVILERGRPGEIYNVGGNHEMENITLVRRICRELGKPERLITYVADRKGHDLRYAIDAGKLQRELGWRPETGFDEGIRRTVQWYLDNRPWWEEIISGEYRDYYTRMYGK